MKLRSGFVSNSSSASYIIKLDMKQGDFYEWFSTHFTWSDFSRSSTLHTITKRMEEYRKSLVEYENETDEKLLAWSKMWTEQTKEMIADYEQLEKELSVAEEPQEWVPLVLKFHHITHCQVASGSLRLAGGTSMHNSYADVPDLLKEIILTQCFEGRCKMECESEMDG